MQYLIHHVKKKHLFYKFYDVLKNQNCWETPLEAMVLQAKSLTILTEFWIDKQKPLTLVCYSYRKHHRNLLLILLVFAVVLVSALLIVKIIDKSLKEAKCWIQNCPLLNSSKLSFASLDNLFLIVQVLYTNWDIIKDINNEYYPQLFQRMLHFVSINCVLCCVRDLKSPDWRMTLGWNKIFWQF